MLTHRITLPDGTEIEFFASDEETFNDKLGDFARLPQPTLPVKKKANKAAKQAQKRQKQARRKQR